MSDRNREHSTKSLLSLAGEEQSDRAARESRRDAPPRSGEGKSGFWRRLMGGAAAIGRERKTADELPRAREPHEAPDRPAGERPHRAPAPSTPGSASTPAGSESEFFRPLIDPRIAMDSLRAHRGTIAALTGLGLLVGVLVALSTPHHYTAVAEIFVDPRELKLVERDIAPDYLANEAALAIVDSKLALVESSIVIDAVVDRAGLADDPEFTGSDGMFDRLFAPIDGFLSIFSADDDGASEDRRAAAAALRESLWAERSSRTFVVEIGVTTLSPEKSAMLANEVAKVFIEKQEDLRAGTARSASNALGGRLQALRADVEEAEEALQRYRTESGLVGPAGRLLTDDQMTAMTAQLADAKAAAIAARAGIETIESADLANVVAGALPQRLVSPALNALRARYAEQRQQLAVLENRLGPRHPRLAEARAALRSVENEITAELRRITEGAQAGLREATRNEEALEGEMAQLKAQSIGDSGAQIRLRELEREVTAAREIYEAFLRRARETGEIENLDATNATIISPAEPPVSPSSTSRKLIVAGYGLGGLMLGLLVALFSAMRAAFAGDSRRESGEAPKAPDPSPPSRGRRSDDRRPSKPTGRPVGPATAAPTAGATMSSRAKEHQKAMYPYRNAPYHPEQDPYRYPEQQQYPAPYGPMDPQGYQAPRAPEYPPMPQQAYPAPGYPQQPHPGQAWGQQPMPPQPQAQPYGAPDHAAAHYAPYGGYPAQPGYPQQPHQPMPAFRPGHPAYAYPEPPQRGPQQAAPQRHEAPVAPRENVYEASPEPGEEELRDLRDSLREIRDTVETLIHRRTERERWSA